MLFTKKSEYALMALSDIALSDGVVNTKMLASKLFIQKPFLAKVLQPLVLKKILHSHKGVSGGFTLAKKPKHITMLDIVNCVEDNEVAVFKCSTSIDNCINVNDNNCMIWKSLNTLQSGIENVLTSLTLEKIITQNNFKAKT